MRDQSKHCHQDKGKKGEFTKKRTRKKKKRDNCPAKCDRGKPGGGLEVKGKGEGGRKEKKGKKRFR